MKLKIKNEKLKILTVLTLSALMAVGCQSKKSEKNRAQDQIIPVKVQKTELRDLEEVINYVGNIKAKEEAVVYPKVTGKIAEKVKEESAAVAKGEVIAYIDRDEVGLKFEKAPVESPLAGIIGRVFVNIGQNVNPQTPVALVVDMDKVRIELAVPEKYLAKISHGQIARIKADAFPEKGISGAVTKISPVVDMLTRAAPIEITVDNPDHLLKSGMFAKVELTIERHEGVPVILKEAVIGKAPDTYVFTVVDSNVHLKKVELGIRQGPYLEVSNGLSEGDMVVIMGQQRLKDGSTVEAQQ